MARTNGQVFFFFKEKPYREHGKRIPKGVPCQAPFSLRPMGGDHITPAVGRMVPLETIRAEAQQMMRYLQNTPLMEGSSVVFFPRERSANTRKDRLTKGIPVDPTTWDQVKFLFYQYGSVTNWRMSCPPEGIPRMAIEILIDPLIEGKVIL